MRHRGLAVKWFPCGVLAGVLAASLLAAAGSASAAVPLRGSPSPAAASPLPKVTEIPPGSGSHGYPYDAATTKASFPGAPTINLARHGYVEREFLMSGATNVYRQSGFWGPDGRWNVSVAQSGVPYTTRLLVRYPSDPGQFNGTVVVEWLKAAHDGDQD